jgi:TPR repeat protein
MYASGRGVVKNKAKAAAFYAKAADQGHASAQYYLGTMQMHSINSATCMRAAEAL